MRRNGVRIRISRVRSLMRKRSCGHGKNSSGRWLHQKFSLPFFFIWRFPSLSARHRYTIRDLNILGDFVKSLFYKPLYGLCVFSLYLCVHSWSWIIPDVWKYTLQWSEVKQASIISITPVTGLMNPPCEEKSNCQILMLFHSFSPPRAILPDPANS